jgi:hypothetical protein
LDNWSSFVLRDSDPEKLINVAAYWDNVKIFRFRTPIGGLIAMDNFFDENVQLSFEIMAVATECAMRSTFKIFVDQTKKLRPLPHW